MHPNEKLLRDGDEAQLNGDAEGLLRTMTDDVVVHINGNNSFAGSYKGKGEFVALFERFMERVPEYTFEPHAYFADDEHGVILQRSHYKRGSERLDTDEAFVCHFRDGRISELWMTSMDERGVDAFVG